MIGRIKFDIDALADEVLDHLPEEVWTSSTTTFLDPALGGGQFVRRIEARLREAGHSDDNIRGRVFGFEKSDLNIRYAVNNKYSLVGQYSRVSHDELFERGLEDILSEKGLKVKPDVIIGNPPYNPPGSAALGQEVWSKFVQLGFSAIRDGGYMSLVTPSGWRLPSKKNLTKKGVHDIINRHAVSWKNCKSYFGNSIGTSIDVDMWLIKKGSLPLRDIQFLPRSSSDRLAVSIFSKLHHYDGDKLQFLKHQFEPAAGDWKCAWTSARWKMNEWKRLSEKRSTFHFDKKVIFSSSGATGSFYDNGECSTDNHSHAIRVKSEDHGRTVIQILEGPLVKFLTQEIVPEGSIENPISWLVPHLPSGDDVYDLLGLTQEEIDHIERTVK